jgi:ribose transport system ATP-binding protein
MKKTVLEMQGITKNFLSVRALNKVNLNVYDGEVMALVGENGAGKSTLMKILSGIYKKDEGEIYFKGEKFSVNSPREAMNNGIAIIHQELNLIEGMSIEENIFMGRFPKKSGRIDGKKMRQDSRDLLERLNLKINSKVLVKDLTIGIKQMVEIAKALSLDAQVIIMDEPTDSLTDKETRSLFNVIEDLKKQGKSIVYISHRLWEVFEICDDVTVLRDGNFIGENKVSEINESILIEMMVGRKLEEQYPYIEQKTDELIFEVKSMENDLVRNIEFGLMKGEILGLAGLMGAGRTDLGQSIFGSVKHTKSEMYLYGKPILVRNEEEAISQGIVYVTEDRKKNGLVLGMSVKENMSLSSLKRYSKGMLLNKTKEKKMVEGYKEKMSIKTPSINQKIKLLSGGNQQKVSIAKALACNPKILILDEPTRGVDVGAKKEIYELMNHFKKEGIGILMISSEIPEILGICDRIMVMREGEIAGILDRKEATQEEIMRLAIGSKEESL